MKLDDIDFTNNEQIEELRVSDAKVEVPVGLLFSLLEFYQLDEMWSGTKTERLQEAIKSNEFDTNRAKIQAQAPKSVGDKQA
jgi:hypothetical protein